MEHASYQLWLGRTQSDEPFNEVLQKKVFDQISTDNDVDSVKEFKKQITQDLKVYMTSDATKNKETWDGFGCQLRLN